MSKVKILICGATGFIGRNITEKFSKQPEFEVHAVRFNRPEYILPNVIWHEADLRRPEDNDSIIRGWILLYRRRPQHPAQKIL